MKLSSTELKRIDLHSHAYVTWEKGKFSLQRGERTLQKIADHCFDIGLDVTALTECRDKRFENLRKTAKYLPLNYSCEDYGNALLVEKDEKEVLILRNQGVECIDGHFLTIGSKRHKDDGLLESEIKKAHSQGAIIKAEHPFTRVMGGMGEKNLLNYLEYITAIETCNAQNINLLPFYPFNAKEADKKAEEFARKHNKPGISVSDSHLLRDMGLAYITTREPIRMDNMDTILASFNDIISNRKFRNVKGYTTRPRLVYWAGVLVYDTLRWKTGLLKSE